MLRETAPATTSARNQAIAVAHCIEQRHSMLPNASPNHNIIAIISLDGLFYSARVFHLCGDAGAVQCRDSGGIAKMATVDEIGQEKQRIAERLMRLDAERAKLAEQLNELEIAERVLSRFGRGATTAVRGRRGRPARAAQPAAVEHRARAAEPASGLSLSDATLKAVQAHGTGATAAEVLTYLSREFGMAVRPNHLGIALQRHRRAGRLESRDSRWHLPHPAHAEAPQAAMSG